MSANPAEAADSLREMEDSALAVQARQGEDAAFMVLVNRHRQKAYWIAYRLIGRHEDARDIVQEAFLRLYRALDRYDPRRRFPTWLYQIVTNLAIDHLRRRRYAEGLSLDAVPPMTAPDAGPVAQNECKELQQAVTHILELLPAKYKAVLVLRDIEGFDSRQTARILQCTHGTARWRLHKARQLFKEAWTARYEPDNEGGNP